MQIATFTTIKSPGIRKCSSTSTCKHALEVDRLRKLDQSQKVKIKDQKRENKEKDNKIAKLKWDLIQSKKASTLLQKKSEKNEAIIVILKEELRIARLSKNSSNSSRPPSTDLFKPKRNTVVSLREKSGKKTGGQPGHKGSTLTFCPDEPDEAIIHTPEKCADCGNSLEMVAAQEGQIHQVIDIRIPPRVLINHKSIVKYCKCGKCNKGEFPKGVQGMVNYGPGISALVANLSVRQYVSYERIVEFLEDLFKIHISEGTVANIIKRIAAGCENKIDDIKENLMASEVVNADETGATVNGKKWWMHTYQNDLFTFIGAHYSRGQIAQEAFFPGGLPYSILVHDCLSMQLATPAAGHQICNVHLLRELKSMMEAHPEIEWSFELIKLIKDAIKLHKDGTTPNRTSRILNRLKKLLDQNMENAPGKIPAMWKRLNKHKDKIFLFLKYPDKKIPPENNAAERAIRNVKVKVKVSGQFKSGGGAEDYAVIRSVIDTANKQKLNIHDELVKITSARFN